MNKAIGRYKKERTAGRKREREKKNNHTETQRAMGVERQREGQIGRRDAGRHVKDNK